MYEPIKEKPIENYPEKKPDEQAKAQQAEPFDEMQQAEPCDEMGQEPIYTPKDIVTENIGNNEGYAKEICK